MTLPNLLDSLDSRGENEWSVCLSVSSVALSCVAMRDVEAEDVDELRGKLKALFASTRNGISLPGALSVALVTFYASVMMVGSLDEVSLNDPDELEEAAAEALASLSLLRDAARANCTRSKVGRRRIAWLQGTPFFGGRGKQQI